MHYNAYISKFFKRLQKVKSQCTSHANTSWLPLHVSILPFQQTPTALCLHVHMTLTSSIPIGFPYVKGHFDRHWHLYWQSRLIRQSTLGSLIQLPLYVDRTLSLTGAFSICIDTDTIWYTYSLCNMWCCKENKMYWTFSKVTCMILYTSERINVYTDFSKAWENIGNMISE